MEYVEVSALHSLLPVASTQLCLIPLPAYLQVEADVLALLVIRNSPGQGIQLINGEGAVIHLHQGCLHAVQLSSLACPL